MFGVVLREVGFCEPDAEVEGAVLDDDTLDWRRRLIDVGAEPTVNSFSFEDSSTPFLVGTSPLALWLRESGSCNLVSALLSAGLIGIVLLLIGAGIAGDGV